MPIKILMPALSPTMTEGNLTKWLKKEGDMVGPGDIIAEIETDKATMEVEAVDEGKLVKIVVAEGTEDVKVNSIIAVLAEEGEKDIDFDKLLSENKANIGAISSNENKVEATSNAPGNLAMPGIKEPAKDKSAVNENQSNKPLPTRGSKEEFSANNFKKTGSNGKILASPLAKRIAEYEGLYLGSIDGTGPGGRIVKDDVLSALEGGVKGKITRKTQEYIEIPNSNMRKTIAKRLLESKTTVPHFYLNIECKMDNLLKAREEINAKLALKAEEKSKVIKISVNDFIILASAKALKDTPNANSSWSDGAIKQFNNVDISVAVAIEGGLVTPIIKNADQKNIEQISSEMKELAKKAREGSLKPEQYQGGGFSISNLGMFGINNFNAIINPPQSCIIAVGQSQKKPIIDDAGNIAVATIMEVTLSCDHRVVDGAIGATFLKAFKSYVESPILMFL